MKKWPCPVSAEGWVTEICERGYCRVDRDESCTRKTPCEVHQRHSPTRLLQALIVLLKGWGWQAQQQ